MSDKAMSTPRWIGLYGAGGFGREVMPLVRRLARSLGVATTTDAIVFVETEPSRAEVNGVRVISEEAFLALEGRRFFNVAIASSRDREEIIARCLARGAEPAALLADNATIYDGVACGEGLIMCANATVTSNVSIGRFVHINVYTYVAHDCVVGDFVTFAPRVSCNGNVHIGRHAYVGAGAVIREGSSGKPRLIGEGAVIGMGAVVTKDVPPNTTVVGNPARVLVR